MKVKRFIYIICFLIVIFPFVFSMLYSIPGADDFSMTYNSEEGFFLFIALKKATDMYFTWSGLWIYMFIEYLCNPVMIFGPTSPMYGVVMILIFGGFLVSLYYLIATILRDVFKINNNTTIFGYYVLFLLCFLNTGIYTEIFYWFIGSVYMWAVSLCMITVALEIKYFFGGFQKKYAIWLSIIGFIACSFFQAAVFPGMVYLVIWICYCRKEKKVLWKQLIPLVIMIIGGLISVVAPGNYVRHDSYDDSGLHFKEAIVQAFFNECVVLLGLVKKPFMWILMIGFGLIGSFNINSIKCKLNPIWYAMIIIFTLFLTCYPLALGISGIGLPNRYYFLLNIYACVMVMVESIYIGVWVKSIGMAFLDNKKKSFKIGLGLIFILIIIWGICSFSKIPYFKTLVDMDGIKLCHDNWMNVYDEIGNSYEEDVVLYLQSDDIENDIIKTPGITYDAQYWENENMASYFDKKTIILLYSNL